MKRLLKLAKNSRGKKLFLQTYVTMSLVRLGLLLVPFKRLRHLIAQSNKLVFLAFAPHEVNISSVVRAVYRSSRYQPGKPMCLARALTTSVIMNIYDFPHEIEIGVAKSKSGAVEAHAWVTSKDKVIVGDLADLSRYVPMSIAGEKLIT